MPASMAFSAAGGAAPCALPGEAQRLLLQVKHMKQQP
jgi:hypothetical protein